MFTSLSYTIVYSHHNKWLGFLAGVLLTSITFISPPLSANPVGGEVVAGSASIQQSPGQTTINQTTDKAIINWQGFSIGANEQTSFVQPSSSAVALNRVTGGNPSEIMGRLNANGQIILVNPAGIIFGKGSQVDVAGMIATTADIKNSDFMAGNYTFKQDPNRNAGIVNEGSITAAERGLVALVAPGVANNGTIRANAGKVILASGTEYTIDLYGDQTIHFATNSQVTQKASDPRGGVLNDAVSNKGAIYADGGQVLLTAKAAENVVDNVINMDGVVQANSIQSSNGQIILAGNESGTVQVAGKMSATGKNSGEKGGTVKVLGKNVSLTETAAIDVDGDAGGGTILVGGNFQGKGVEQNAQTTKVAKGAKLNASAITKGNGGKIIVWADDHTDYEGSIIARGGATGGDGGFAEVSGKNTLGFRGTVDLTAPYGNTGELLLDPGNITISTGTTSATPSGSPTNSYTGSDSANTIVNTTDLVNALANASVTIQTGTASSGADGNITVANSFSWSSANSLTLKAYKNIELNSGTIITNTGGGNVTLRAGYTGTGSGSVTGTGTIALSGGSGQVKIYYNPSSYTSPTNFSSNVTSGTLTAYMLINNATQLQDMNTNLSGTYALATNINASSISNFSPVGNNSTPFTGSLDGQNYVISNLTISLSGTNVDVGLFGKTSGATISNVGLVDGSITATTNTGGVGSLIGRAASSSTISNVFAIDTSVTGGTTALQQGMGGLIGTLDASTITNSYISGGTVTNTQSTYAGGLIGYAGGNITTSYSNNTVTSSVASGYVGGLLGWLDSSRSATNTYSLSNVTNSGNSTSVGGLVGANASSATISTSYSTGSVTNTGSSANVGGLVGVNSGTITNGYYDSSTSGQTAGVGSGTTTGVTAGCFTGSGCTAGTANLSAQSTYTGFNFSTTWYSINGSTRPMLRMEYVTDRIRTAHQLQMIPISMSANYELASNVNMSEITQSRGIWGTSGTFVPIGTSSTPFTGTFDGNNYVINNLTINLPTTDNVGLFGYISGGTINNVGLEDATVTGQNNVGGLIGTLIDNSTVTQTYSNGSITGTLHVGGLMGEAAGTGITISQSYSLGTVTATGISSNTGAGGLIGTSSATISDSYSLANVYGGDVARVGGFVGQNTGTISTSYSIGVVTTSNSARGGFVGFNNGTITNSFWDTDTSGLSTSVGGGTAKTTSQMAAQSTFTGFNFSSTWGIVSNTTYPYLQWRFSSTPQVVKGVVYSDQGTTAVTSSSQNTLTLATAGTALTKSNNMPTYANGAYYFLLDNNTIPTSTTTLLYLKNGSDVTGTNVFLTNNPNTTSLNVYNNTLIARSDSGTALTNTSLGTVKGSLSNSGILYSVSGGNLTTTSGVNFLGWNNTNYNLDGNITTSGGNITLQGAVNLTANSTLNAGTGAISFSSTINGAQALTLTGTGGITLGGAVGGTTPLTGFTETGAITLNGGSIVTAGAQTYNGAITLGANTTISTTTSSLTFGNTINGAYTLTLSNTSISLPGVTDIYINGAIGNTTPLASFTETGNLALNSSGITTTGAQTYNSVITLGANTTLTSNNSTLTFANTIDGAYNLTLSGTGITLAAVVGGTTSLASFTETGPITVNGTGVDTTGNQTYNGAITLGNNIVFTSSAGHLTFNNTINGNRVLTLDSPQGITTINGAIGGTTALTSLTTNAGGTTHLANNITANGAIDLNQNILLTGNSIITSNNNSVTLDGTVDGNYALTLNADNIYLNKNIGQSTPIYSLVSNSDNPLSLSVDIAAQGTTITFNHPSITLADHVTLANTGNIIFNGTLNGLFNLVLTATQGNIIFSDIVGGIQALKDVTVNNAHDVIATKGMTARSFTQNQGAGTTNFAAGLTTTGNIIINTAHIFATLIGGNTTLNGSQSLFANVIVSALTLDGDNGGIVNGTIAGYSGFQGALATQLARNALGEFVVNGCLIPGGCVSFAVYNQYQTEQTNDTAITDEPACTYSAATGKGNSGNQCQSIDVKMKDENDVDVRGVTVSSLSM